MPYDSYSIHVDSEIKLLRNIKKFNRLPHVFLFKMGIATWGEEKSATRSPKFSINLKINIISYHTFIRLVANLPISQLFNSFFDY